MIIVRTVAGWLFDTLGGRALAAVGGLLALVAWWQIDRALATRAAYNAGAAHATSGFEQASDALAAKMGAAADSARDLDAHERLRVKWCRDCGGR